MPCRASAGSTRWRWMRPNCCRCSSASALTRCDPFLRWRPTPSSVVFWRGLRNPRNWATPLVELIGVAAVGWPRNLIRSIMGCAHPPLLQHPCVERRARKDPGRRNGPHPWSEGTFASVAECALFEPALIDSDALPTETTFSAADGVEATAGRMRGSPSTIPHPCATAPDALKTTCATVRSSLRSRPGRSLAVPHHAAPVAWAAGLLAGPVARMAARTCSTVRGHAIGRRTPRLGCALLLMAERLRISHIVERRGDVQPMRKAGSKRLRHDRCATRHCTTDRVCSRWWKTIHAGMFWREYRPACNCARATNAKRDRYGTKIGRHVRQRMCFMDMSDPALHARISSLTHGCGIPVRSVYQALPAG